MQANLGIDFLEDLISLLLSEEPKGKRTTYRHQHQSKWQLQKTRSIIHVDEVTKDAHSPFFRKEKLDEDQKRVQ